MIVGIVDEAATRELRRAVLRPNLAPGDPLPGDDLPEGVHFGATDDDGAVVSTCFVYPDPCPWLPSRAGAWRLRQMATRPEQRGAGLGAAVLDAAVQYVLTRGGDVIWCNARERAVPFYTRCGFQPYGAVFTDERHTIPHLRMWRELAGAPASS